MLGGSAGVADSLFSTQHPLVPLLLTNHGFEMQSVLSELLVDLDRSLLPEVGDRKKIILRHLDEVTDQHLAVRWVFLCVEQPVATQAVTGSLAQLQRLDGLVEDRALTRDRPKLPVDHGLRVRSAGGIALVVRLFKCCFQQLVDVRIGVGGRRVHKDSPKLCGAVLVFLALRCDQLGYPK